MRCLTLDCLHGSVFGGPRFKPTNGHGHRRVIHAAGLLAQLRKRQTGAPPRSPQRKIASPVPLPVPERPPVLPFESFHNLYHFFKGPPPPQNPLSRRSPVLTFSH